MSQRPASNVRRPSSPSRLGLIAGWGRYPIVVAEALQRQGIEVYCLGVRGEADPALAQVCTHFRWSGMARFGGAIAHFKRHGVTSATMAGKIHKVRLFEPLSWLKLLPDWRTVRMFAPHLLWHKKDCKDDTLLGRIVDEFATEGIHFAPATDFCPELLVSEGPLTRRLPTAKQQADIAFGWQVAKEIGRLDIGQSVTVKNQAVLAVEAIEGTDACIRRAGELCRAGGFTIVKTAKPQQDMRFDVPTIGLRTIRGMIDAGAQVLAIEAERTILLEHQEVIELADRHGLRIVSLAEPAQQRRVA